MEILEETELCIVCNKPVPGFDVKTERQDCWDNDVPTGSFQTPLQETETDLLPELRVIFLLQQVFKHSLHDESMLETMQVLGNPSEWFEICKGCSALVDAGIYVLRKLKRYEDERIRILEKLDRSFSSSFWGGTGNFGENSKLLRHQGEDNSRRRKRSEFRNKIRGIETACVVDDEIKHELCDPTNVPEADDEDWASCNIGFEYPSVSFSPPMEDVEYQDKANDQPKMRKLRPRRKPSNKNPQNQKNFNVRYNTRTQNKPKKKKVSSHATNHSMSRVLLQTPGRHQTGNAAKQRALRRRRREENQRKEQENLKTDEEKRKELLERRSNQRIEYIRERWKKNLQTKRGLKVYERYNWFYEKCHEYLDMSLVTYPPPPSEDQNSQLSPETNEKSSKSDVHWYLKEEGFPCTTCDASFVNMYHTIAHIHHDHLGVEEPWKCNQCPYTDRFRSSFRDHVREHRKLLQTCKICNTYSTREQKYMDIHVINHQKGVTNPICGECQQSFYNFKAFVEHMTNQHGLSYRQISRPTKRKEGPPVVCQFCNKAWPSCSKLQLRFHLFKIHNYGELDERFQVCSECGNVCISRAALEVHMTRHHADKTEGVEKFFCEHCGREYKLESDLKAHVRSAHHEDPQTCRICGVEFRNPGKLRLHTVRRHSETLEMSPEELDEYILKKNEEKPFECNLCKGRFPFSNLLYHHYRTSHPEVTEKFKCDICGKGFSRQCSVKRHKESAHDEVKVTCEGCGKMYPNDSLRQHQRHHCPAKKRKEKDASTQHQEVQLVVHDSYDQQQPEGLPPVLFNL